MYIQCNYYSNVVTWSLLPKYVFMNIVHIKIIFVFDITVYGLLTSILYVGTCMSWIGAHLELVITFCSQYSALNNHIYFSGAPSIFPYMSKWQGTKGRFWFGFCISLAMLYILNTEVDRSWWLHMAAFFSENKTLNSYFSNSAAMCLQRQT